jgi:hypothetical protein
MKANLYIGFNCLGAIVLMTTCVASEVQVIRLASPEAVVGAPPDTYRPALTGQGGPVAWRRQRPS